jgi:hypothetical protein
LIKKLKIDIDEVQKAMEDVSREAFDYFLDTDTGEVIILSDDIMNRAQKILYERFDEDMEDYDEVEFDEETDVPDWMEEEIELALEVFLLDKGRYVRIPERNSGNAYAAMQEFTEALEDLTLRRELRDILNGRGAFRKFKDALDPYPKERKMWYGYNAKKAKREIGEWLRSLGIEPERDKTVASDP